MKAKTLLTALFAFLLVNGNAFTRNSSLNIDVIEHPAKTYVIEMGNGSSYETSSDIRIDNLRYGRNGLKIYTRTYKGSKRGPQRFDERLVYTGAIDIPNNATVFSQLSHRGLFVNNIVPNINPRYANNQLGMQPRQFENLLFAVERESFDKDKVAIMTHASRNGAINSRQVLELMSLLSFDSYKLQFAKTAYRNTVDKQNYFIVRDGLSFTSSKRKLTDFMNQQTAPPHNKDRRGNQRRR